MVDGHVENMKTECNILLTGSNESDRNDFAKVLKEGFTARGISSAVVKLDPNHPQEGNKSVGYQVGIHVKVVITFGCLDAKKDEARYERIARPDEPNRTFYHLKISKG